MTALSRRAILVCLIVPMCACQTVQSTFGGGRPDYTTLPEAEMRQVASAIERAIAAGDREAPLPTSASVSLDTEEIRHAIETRKARIHLVDELRANGYAWEKRDGLMHIRSSSEYKQATTRRDRDRHALVAYSENQNRWELYEGIVKANNLRPKALDAVQAIFAEARFEAMGPGKVYETPDGESAITQ